MRTLILVVCYPLVTHYSVATQTPWPAVILLFLIAASILGDKQKGKRFTIGAGLSVAALMAVGYGMSRLMQQYEFVVLYFPPVFISLALLFIFGRTLLPGHTPIITTMARIYHGGDIEPELKRYTLHATIAWTLLFAFLTIESVVLAFFASLETWSLYTNGINYILVLTMIVLEHFIRIRRFSHIKFPGLVGFIRMLKQTDFSRLYKS